MCLIWEIKQREEVLQSCVEDGYDAYVCACGETKKVVLPAIGHHTPSNVVQENDLASTCSEKGHYDLVVYCSVCNREISRETRLTEATGLHEFNCRIVSEEYLKCDATCDEPAIYYYSCKCGEVGTEMFYDGEALGHVLIHHEAKDKTCTESGWNEYDSCSRCDYTTFVQLLFLICLITL